MTGDWKEKLECALYCPRCNRRLAATDPRILSVYDHEPICTDCKKEEESRPDYAEVSKNMIGECMADSELHYSDPGGYCYHHFYGYTC